jgi:hypothetical protein
MKMGFNNMVAFLIKKKVLSLNQFLAPEQQIKQR